MPARDKDFLIRVRADIQDALKQLKLTEQEVRRLAGQTQDYGKQARGATPPTRGLGRANNELESSYAGVARMVTRAVTAFATYKLAGLIKDSAILAAQNETLGVVLGVVGRNAGIGKGYLEGLVEQVKALGITSRVANQAIIRMTQLQLDLGKAAELARVAQDAAVVGLTNSSEALDRIIHGIITLQPEVLRTVGITVTFEKEYARVAKELERTADSLSENEKRQIALNAVLREGGTLAGAYTGAMETAAKQMGSLARLAETAQEEIGKLFQGPFGAAISAATAVLRVLVNVFRDLNIIFGTAGYESYALEKIDEQIKNIEKRRDALKQEIAREGFFGLLGRKFALPFFSIEDELSSLRLQLQELKKAREIVAQQEMRRGVVDRGAPASLGPDDATIAATEKLNKKAQELTAALQQQTATLGEGAEAMAFYRITEGDLQGVDKWLALEVLHAAVALDEKTAALQRAAEAARNAATDNDLLESLAEEIALVGESNKEKAIAAALARLSADATEDQRDAIAALAGALEDANEAERQYQKTMEQGRAIFERTRTAEEKFALQLAEIDRLYEEGAFGAVGSAEAIDTLGRAARGAKKDFDEFGETGTNVFEELTKAVQGWGREFTDTLADAVMTGKADFKDLANSIIRDLLRIQIQKRITDPLVSAGTSFLDTLFVTPKAAGGGLITGPGTATSDSIPARLSAGEYVVRAKAVDHYGARFLDEINRLRAPRFAAGGLVPQLFAPVRRFSEGGLAAAGGGAVRIEIANTGAPKAVSDAQVSIEPGGLVVRVITDDVRRGGPISNSLARTFGLRRSGG